MKNRTRAYWPTRILLLVGIVATMLAVWFAVLITTQYVPMGPNPEMLLPSQLMAVAAAAVAVIGLVWMVRIFRGPRDQPPRWRYRD